MIRLFFWSGLFLGILDLYLLYRIGCVWGVWPVLGILFLPAWFGLRVVLRQGLRCMNRIGEEISSGRNPSQKVAEAPLILASGLLLLVPGPVTTVLGLLLMIPGLRRFLASRLLLGVRKAGVVEAGAGADANSGVFVRVVQIGGSSTHPEPHAEIKEAEGREVEPAAERQPKELPGQQGVGDRE